MLEIHGGNVYDYNNITDFSANINPLGILPEVMDAIHSSLKGIINYPDIYCNALRRELAVHENVNQEYIICSNGAADLIFQVVFASSPKKALLVAPGFYEYEQALKIHNTKINYYQLREENDFELEESFLNHISEDIDIIFLCNPNNPTGKTIENNLLKRIIKEVTQKEILLVIDECFIDFTENSNKNSAKANVLNNKYLFVLKAFTKIYAMPGLRLGYGLCSNKELISKIHEIRQPWSVSVPAQAAGIAAIGNDKYKKQTLEYIKIEREYLYKSLSKLKIKYYKSEANFILFKWIKDLKKQLLEHKILIRDCSNYRGLGDGYYRIAVKSRHENEILISALTKIYKDLSIRR